MRRRLGILSKFEVGKVRWNFVALDSRVRNTELDLRDDALGFGNALG